MPGRGIAKAGGCCVHFPQGMASKEHDFHALLRIMIHMVHLPPILAATRPPSCHLPTPGATLHSCQASGGRECFVLTLNLLFRPVGWLNTFSDSSLSTCISGNEVCRSTGPDLCRSSSAHLWLGTMVSVKLQASSFPEKAKQYLLA